MSDSTSDDNKGKHISHLNFSQIGVVGELECQILAYQHPICVTGNQVKVTLMVLIAFEPGKENFNICMAVYDLFENLLKNEKIEIVTKNGLSKYIGSKILNDVMYV